MDWTNMIVGSTYELVQLIGRGGLSTVYKAEIISGKRFGLDAAVKIMQVEDDDPRHLSFLLREAYEYSRLNHSGIPRFYDFGKAGADCYFLAMEYVRGESLVSYVRRVGLLNEFALCHIATQILDALCYVESVDILHRDVKPDNILINTEGEAVLVDFGMAKRTGDSSITIHDQEVKGSPGYLSPEQLCADPDIDIRTDVFSLGCTLYFCAYGTSPFLGETPAETCMAVMHSDPPSLLEAGARVSPEFSEVVQRMMLKNFNLRPSPSELREELSVLMSAAGAERS